VGCEWVVWDDPAVDWGRYEAVVIRSTWDYHRSLGRFLRWCEEVDAVTRLVNPAPLARWNAHKRYLVELADAGVPVVPTELVTGGSGESLAAVADRRGWDEVVLKPAVGAGSVGTSRHRPDDPAAERAFAALAARGDVLVQPFLSEIESRGETSVVVVDGTVTHAVAKVPAAGDFRVQEQYGGRRWAVEPTAAEVALAREAVTFAGATARPVYARVDCATVDGAPHVMELEVIEPALFLPLAPAGTADALVAAVVAGGEGSGAGG
jgi:glutathione synthase/RimK-type ligase-like ATP-grasp enzyme